VITYDDVPTYSLSVMEISDGLVTHETQYFADPSPPLPSALRSLSRFRPATNKPGRARFRRARTRAIH
jgi:hypothetical protein